MCESECECECECESECACAHVPQSPLGGTCAPKQQFCHTCYERDQRSPSNRGVWEIGEVEREEEEAEDEVMEERRKMRRGIR